MNTKAKFVRLIKNAQDCQNIVQQGLHKLKYDTVTLLVHKEQLRCDLKLSHL